MRRQDYNPGGVNLPGSCSGFPNNFIIEVRHKFSSEIARNADFRSGWIDSGFNLVYRVSSEMERRKMAVTNLKEKCNYVEVTVSNLL